MTKAPGLCLASRWVSGKVARAWPRPQLPRMQPRLTFQPQITTKGRRCYRGVLEARAGTAGTPSLGLGGGGKQGGGVLGLLEKQKESQPVGARLCFRAQPLGDAMRADRGDGCGVGSQGLGTGPRPGSELHPQVPPAWCGATLGPGEPQLSRLHTGDKVPALPERSEIGEWTLEQRRTGAPRRGAGWTQAGGG